MRLGGASAVLLLSACAPDGGGVNRGALKLFRPLPSALPSASNPVTRAKAELGRMLFFDARLSRGRDISCNSCHDLAKYGADGRPVSVGYLGRKGERNAPTVYNAAGHFAQFWDGRARDVEEQAKGPVMNPVEMAMPSEAAVTAVLASEPAYVEAFRRVFPGERDPLTFDNAARAVGAFERGLVTPSRWDRFLKGDRSALTQAEKAGFNGFVEAGCAACHIGAFVGGTSLQKLGMVKPWGPDPDQGRFKVTGRDSDRLLFKVPSLRNVAETAPYFHNGGVATLEEAVRKMAEYQTGKRLAAADVQSIITWLKTLTGDLPPADIKRPVSPGR